MRNPFKSSLSVEMRSIAKSLQKDNSAFNEHYHYDFSNLWCEFFSRNKTIYVIIIVHPIKRRQRDMIYMENKEIYRSSGFETYLEAFAHSEKEIREASKEFSNIKFYRVCYSMAGLSTASLKDYHYRLGENWYWNDDSKYHLPIVDV